MGTIFYIDKSIWKSSGLLSFQLSPFSGFKKRPEPAPVKDYQLDGNQASG
jgi:hypothetical protein